MSLLKHEKAKKSCSRLLGAWGVKINKKIVQSMNIIANKRRVVNIILNLWHVLHTKERRIVGVRKKRLNFICRALDVIVCEEKIAYFI